MKIQIPDANLQRAFNSYASLKAHYGEDLAMKIAVRVSLLSAARHLGLIPRRPPIRLKPVDGSNVQYTVDLILPRRLRFGALNGRRVPNEQVEEIQILAVD